MIPENKNGVKNEIKQKAHMHLYTCNNTKNYNVRSNIQEPLLGALLNSKSWNNLNKINKVLLYYNEKSKINTHESTLI